MTAKQLNNLADLELIALLRGGAVGVIPTDTVYGLVARADSEVAVNRLYSTKLRERQPGTIIGASVEQLIGLGFKASDLELSKKFWPGAVSVVMSAQNIDDYLKTDLSSLPARIPNNPDLINLLEKVGPLMTTSANSPKQPTSTTVQMAYDYFGDNIDFYVDWGDLSNQPPSTIIGIQPDQSIVIYRQGAVKITLE